jgi:hypothetical protein
VNEQVQKLLAEGGCPGWIALANEPHALDGTVTPAAAFFDEPPVMATAAPQAPVDTPLQLAPLPPPDDDLISEEEDLLSTSPEIVGNEADAAADPAPAARGADSARPQGGGDVEGDELLDEGDDLVAPAEPAGTSPVIVPPPTEPSVESSADSPTAPSADPGPAPSTEILPAPAVQSTEELLKDRSDMLEPMAPRPRPLVPPLAAPVQPPVSAPAPAPIAPAAGGAAEAKKQAVDAAARCEFVAKSLYPSAGECRACHEKIYDEWSISSHAYAFVSPMFHKFEQKINDLTSGTIGYFCYRCHTPAGTSLGLSRAAPIWDAPLVAREGVTCVACHRVREFYGKTNGERRIEPGDIHSPVWGTIGGDGVAAVVAQKDAFKVHTSPHDTGPGIDMHATAECMPQLGQSEFCTSCHQVAVYPGIKLEVVWEQYRASPACKKGIKCQECHMGRIPGVPSGYEFGPAALINNKSVGANRKHSNHTFYGPGYSIAHPGVFPFNPKAQRWSVRDWLLFDWRAGWGTDAFEDAVADGKIRVAFPAMWKESDDRCDARDIIEANLEKRAGKDRLRAQVMENGSHVDGPFFEGPQRVGQELKFAYVVINTNDGHNLPTASLGAQPQLWANVVLIGPRGQRLWQTGHLDSNGDLADIHSEDVRNKRLEFDWQLFNLQTMFLITGAKGTDREFFLPVNIDIDPLPFIRPQAQPVSLLNHPPFIRMEARSLPPLGSRRVPYKVPGELLCEPGRYRLTFRMRNRTEPPYFMRFCESTVEMQRAMIEGTLDFHESSVEFDVR